MSRFNHERQSERLLTAAEASEMLAVKRSTLYQWAYERRIPTVKLGRALRFKLSDLEKLIARSERPALRQPNERV